MENAQLTIKTIIDYQKFLFEAERTQSTISKYMRDVQKFYEYLKADKIINKEVLVSYKQSLLDGEYQMTSINSMLVSINGVLDYLGMSKLKLKLIKIQKKAFSEDNKDLNKEEYKRLLEAAMHEKNKRLYMLLQAICGTGIRVSEHKFITVEALKNNKATIHNKGKVRVIFIPQQLTKVLLMYCQKEGIESGPIFITKGGRPMDRSNIWESMKRLCKEANVDQHKVFPHNLRHLFATTYYKLQKDVVRLADILGHSSIETTRIYTKTSGKECEKYLQRMNLTMPYS